MLVKLKNTKVNTLKTKVNNLESKQSKQNLEKKIEDVDKIIPDTKWFSDYKCFEYKKKKKKETDYETKIGWNKNHWSLLF